MSENEPAATPNPTATNPINTIGDMMQALETHVQDILAGRMTDSTARSVMSVRKAQLKSAELQLQYARIFKGRAPEPVMKLLPSAETLPKGKLTPEEAATLKALQDKARG